MSTLTNDEINELQSVLDDAFMALMVQHAPAGGSLIKTPRTAQGNRDENYNAFAQSVLFNAPLKQTLSFTNSCENAAHSAVSSTHKGHRDDKNATHAHYRNKQYKTTTSASTQPDLNVDDIDLVARYIGDKSEHAARDARRQANRAKIKTAGKKWFDLPATQVNQDIRNAYTVLQNRAQLTESGHFIRTEKSNKLPKYFQIGTVIDNDPNSYENLSKKQKSRTLTDQFYVQAKSSSGYNKKLGSMHAKNASNPLKNHKKAKYSNISRK